ncbi:fibronectin type III domain-containing protein [Artemisia annua]|uniref:Fibronectin type III domain-containing protein n=1 Tax=Artemisia annua TaxID=35608 RepID=A0A2U1NJ89_ARTAN|nr:fibronectin type III domain-containing protein [Artemisia annua]
MAEASVRLNKKLLKNHDLKKASVSPKCTRKQNRKGENPVRIPLVTESCGDAKISDTWICKNSACRAVLSVADTFCKRCSCCICHLFDDNKDPSLWLECTSDSSNEESCGLSCHIECALQHRKVGVVNLGQLMQLDGSYCCASCGKVSGILGYWKKQLTIAKDARRVDSLCSRIYLSYRLLDGTSRFQELHKIVKEAKTKLETEVGPLSGVSARMARGIVSRLTVAGEVQALCSTVIAKADEFSATISSTNLKSKEGSLPAACKFIFEEVAASSVVLVLIELSTALSSDIIGFKLWYSKTTETTTYTKDPVKTFPKSQRRILISNLQPCTEYVFRVVSYTETGDLGHSEAKCFTGSVEIIHKIPSAVMVTHNEGTCSLKDVESDSGFRVRELGKIVRLAWAQERGYLDGISDTALNGPNKVVKPETPKSEPSSNGLDLNVATVPDLNEEIPLPADSFRDEDNPEPVTGSGESESWAHQVSNGEVSRKRPSSTLEESHDCDSTLINGSPFGPRKGGPGSLDETFEYCVKTIRSLECQGYIKQEFRLKLLTWFSLRSTEQERRVVNTYIQTLIDDPCSLAGQLVHSFADIINNKRLKNGFCSKLWH